MTLFLKRIGRGRAGGGCGAFMLVCCPLFFFKYKKYTRAPHTSPERSTLNNPPHPNQQTSYPARGGGTVEIDARPSALRAALGPQLLAAIQEGEEGGGLIGVGMKASTPYGEGRVVGVARGDIWCVVAWCWGS